MKFKSNDDELGSLEIRWQTIEICAIGERCKFQIDALFNVEDFRMQLMTDPVIFFIVTGFTRIETRM